MKKILLDLGRLSIVFCVLLFSRGTYAQIANTEGFNAGTVVPAGWTDFLTSGSNTWTYATAGTSPTCAPQSGAGMAKFDSYDASGGVRSLITPAFSMAGNASGSVVSFWMYRDNGYNTTADKIDVMYNTSPTPVGAFTLGTVNRARGLAPVVAANGWYQYTFTIPTGVQSSTVYLILRGTSAYGNNIYIDNVSWQSFPPACAGTPNTPTIGGATTACAGANFTITSTGGTNAIGISYQWQSSIDGGATWTPVAGATSTSLTTNANITTQYQLVTTCANGGATSASAPYTVTVTPFSGCTCISYPAIYASSTFDEEITNVTVGSMNNTSDCFTAATGPGSILNRYGNYAGVVAGHSAQQGNVVPFSLTQTSCGGNYGSFFQIYLDWNQDGDFLDAGEQVYVQNPSFSGNNTVTGSFTVPMNAAPGVTRMRVVHIESSSSTTNYAHTSYSWGETEDYCFTVTVPPPCAGTPAPGNTLASQAAVASGTTTNLSLQNQTPGTGVTYQWYSSPDGLTYTAVIGQTAPTYTATVTANTWYYCDVTCSGVTTASTPVQVTLTYCTPSTSTGTTYYISNFTTNNAVVNVSNTTGFSAGGYGNFSATQVITGLSGASVSFNAAFLNASTYGFAMWIDVNQDLDFNDPGEQVYNSAAYITGVTNGTFTIPAGCLPGQSYRLRIRNDWFSGSPQPCGNISYGEAEDYTLTIAPNCSAMPAAPVAALTGTTPICYGLTTAMSASGITLEGGISNQWAYSTTPGGPYTNFTGATNLAYTTSTSLAPNTYYVVLNSTCTLTSQTATSNEITFTIDGASSNFTMVPPSFCGVGGTSTLTASPSVLGATYTWTNNGGTLSTNAGDNTVATISQTSEFTLSVSYNGCSSQTTQSIGVYSFPAITPTATPSTICGGTSSLLESGLTAGNFAAICIPPVPEVSPVLGFTDLVVNGVANVALSSGSLDDGGWGNIPLGFSFNFFGTNYSNINVGTNGVLQFGNYNGAALQDFTIGALPNLVDPLAAIFASAGDLHCGYAGASVRYWTAGAAPNRRFILDYQGFRYGNAAQNVKFQVIIYETLGQVDVVVIENAATNNKTIGINSPSGTIGAAAPNCAAVPNTPGYWQATANTIPAASPQAFKFIPPVNYVYNWTINGTPNPAQDQLNGVTVSTSTTSQSPLASTNYQVYIQDPITNCSQVFQTPVTVLATPAAPIAVNWTQCGTQVPQANVSCPTCTGNETFNWYSAAVNGTLYQGVINENFNTGTTGSLYGDASLTGARCVLTDNVASQNGALLLGSTGVNSNAYNIDFDFQVGPSDALGYNGADGFSYSFGDDVNATAVSPAAENGSGTKLKVGFVSYTNGGSTAGIYLMYNCTTDEQTPATPGVIAYSNDMTWKNTATPVAFQMTIDNIGQVNLSLNGNPIFTNVPLPANYLLENKATWQQLFKARTGAGFSRHAVDNVHVEAQPSQQFATIQQPVSTSATYYVQTVDGLCGSTTLTPISITVNPAPAFGITSSFTGCQNNVYPLTVTAGVNDFTNFVWSPAAILFMDQALTTPYVAGTSATTVYFSAANVGVQPAISCAATDGGIGALQCGANASMTITVQANPLAPTITSGVQAVCSGNSTTLDVQSGALGASYCASSANYTGDEEITNVTIGTLNQTSDCFTPGTGATSVLEQYADYTSGAGAPAAPSLTAGTNAAGSVTVSTCGFFNYTSGLAIFIDLNQDGDFIDAGEKVYSNGGASNIDCVPATVVPVSLTIPASALNGVTRMRVVNRESISGDAITPCTVNGWGETEDYLVNITGGITYTYTWSPAVTNNATTASVTTLPLTSPTTYTAVLNDGTCSSPASAPITVAIAGTPVLTPTASVPQAQYCVPSYSTGTAFDDYIGAVQLGTINNITAGAPLPAVTLYPNTGSTTTTLAAGSAQTISLSSGIYPFDQNIAVWIDYNQNGVFTDAGELLGEVPSVPNFPATSTINFNVPANAVSGPTRMRVRLVYAGVNIDPCGGYSFGEVEDYEVNITGGVTNIACPGSTFNLNAVATNGGQPYTYTWSVLSGNATISNPAIASPTALVSSDATFQVTANDVCGASVTATITADVDENPITVNPISTTICALDSTLLTASNGFTYSWTPNNTLVSNNTAAVSAFPTTTTVYTVLATYGNGCVGSATTTVNVNALPLVSAGPNQTVCLNTSVVVNGSGANSYTWNNNVIDNTPFTPNTTNNYVVAGVDNNGCINYDTVTITVLPLPNVNAGQDFGVCIGNWATLTGSGASTYQWNNNITNGTVFFPNTTATYTVIGTGANGCSAQDSVVVTVNTTPTISLTNGGAACANGNVALNATTTGAFGGFWSSTNGLGTFGPNISNTNVIYNANANDPATVTFVYVAFNQCGASNDTTTINILGLPTVNAGIDASVCTGTNTTLTATSTGTVVWNNGVLDGVAFPAVGGTSNYIATATDANGCTNADTVAVTGLALPQVNAGSDQTVCAGDFVTLSASGAVTYAWDNNVIDGVPVAPLATTTYTVTGTGANGCDNTDNVTVTVNALPNAVAIQADPVTLVATPAGATYQWIDCASGQIIADATNDTLVATANGSYAVIVTNANGCSDTSDCMIVDQVGIYFPESAVIGLYPNPTNGMVTLELPAQDGATAFVYDAQGKLILTVANAQNGEQFDLSKLSTGVYTFRVTLNNLTHIEKVVKH